jgi:cellulose synthase/poly-beta-1,6-N-acetylglucosamine synthase-like glycosyltransferase/peptidoglycan/xylan/chitin deacetylase (PgdA/CDA1 family)
VIRRRRHRELTRHFVIAASLVTLVTLLLIQGFTTKTVGAETKTSTAGGAPLANLPPVLTDRGGRFAPVSNPASRRMVALTFDDGPSPLYTRRIAHILLAAHAPATFFEVGSMVVRWPSITRQLQRDGFEIGNHTFTHANLAGLPTWERNAQISATDSAIAGVTGFRPRLVRPPYASTTSAVTPAEARALSSVIRRGYDLVFSTYDTEDWTLPGVRTIVRNALPPGRQGGIVLMHDAGGQRWQTVKALPRIIHELRARGFQLVDLSTYMGVPRSTIEVPVSSWQQLRGALLVWVLRMINLIVSALTLLVEGVTAIVGLRMAAGLALALIQRRRVRSATDDPSFTPPVSIVVPAFNEAVGIARCVRSLASSRYGGDLEVVVVDDGSSDETAAIVEGLGLARVRLLREANSGKAAALNRALEASRNEIIVTVDADTVFEPDTLRYLVQRFRDPAVGVISGNTKIGNRGSLVGRWQHIEYVMGFNLDRRAYELIGATPTVPGAIGAFRRRALADIGGVSGATLAEDTDVTLELGRAGWAVVYEPRARAWTEAPAGLRALYRQRTRWAYGTIQSAWKHRAALWGRGEHTFGRRAVAVLLAFQIALPLAAPLIDLFAIYSITFLDPMPILAFWLAFNLFQLTLAWVAFGLDGESRRPLWALPLQQIAWRQITYFVVLDGIILALSGRQVGWRHLERTGAVVTAVDSPAV